MLVCSLELEQSEDFTRLYGQEYTEAFRLQLLPLQNLTLRLSKTLKFLYPVNLVQQILKIKWH